METRKIVIVSTRDQKKSVIMSAATTLAELKADLRQNNIDYTDMTFYEGTSKTELRDNASVLPHDVPYKGKTTNELVFMLTNTNKKIRSGADMNRAEAYAAIKANGLQEECAKRFGYNYTICKTSDLISLINEKVASKPTPVVSAKDTVKKTSVKKEKVTETKKEESRKQNSNTDCVDTKARAALSELLDIFLSYDVITSEEVTNVKNILGGEIEVVAARNCKPSSASSYSDSEIDAMFDFVE